MGIATANLYVGLVSALNVKNVVRTALPPAAGLQLRHAAQHTTYSPHGVKK